MDKFIKKFSKTFRYGQKGFTLIELLIVIAVLGTCCRRHPNVVGL